MTKETHRQFTLKIPTWVWEIVQADAKLDGRKLGPQIVRTLERALARRKAVAE
jgi:hypothetical protein